MFKLLFPGEYVLGKTELVANCGHFALNGLVDRNTGLTGETDLIFLLACGVDAVSAGSLLCGTNFTDDVTGYLTANVLAEEVVGVDSDEEVTEVEGNLLAVLKTGKSLTVGTVLESFFPQLFRTVATVRLSQVSAKTDRRFPSTSVTSLSLLTQITSSAKTFAVRRPAISSVKFVPQERLPELRESTLQVKRNMRSASLVKQVFR